MGMTIYKLFGQTFADGTASLDIQLDGEIESIYVSGEANGCDAMDDGFNAEVSFLSSNTFAINDSRGSLAVIQSRAGLLTSGGWNAAVNMNISNLGVPVNAGERIHLHISQEGGAVGVSVHAYLYVRDRGTGRTAARRR